MLILRFIVRHLGLIIWWSFTIISRFLLKRSWSKFPTLVNIGNLVMISWKLQVELVDRQTNKQDKLHVMPVDFIYCHYYIIITIHFLLISSFYNCNRSTTLLVNSARHCMIAGVSFLNLRLIRYVECCYFHNIMHRYPPSMAMVELLIEL